MLETHLIAHDCSHLITENANNGYLTKNSTKVLCQQVASYLITTHTIKPKYVEIVNVCKATTELFPFLIEHDSIEGIVSSSFINL